jgi:hypothetical protein
MPKSNPPPPLSHLKTRKRGAISPPSPLLRCYLSVKAIIKMIINIKISIILVPRDISRP